MSDVARTAVNQAPHGGTDYPFVGTSPLSGAVLDFYLSYDDQECAYAFPFTLTLSGATLTVTEAGGATVAAVSIGLQTGSTAWGDRTVYAWEDGQVVVRAVVRDDLLDDGEGVLDPRTCDRLPARVRSLRVGLIRVSGPVVFQAGSNIDMAVVQPVDRADGGRFATQVTLDAVPGAGAGRVGGCEESEALVRRINRISPDCGGNFKIELGDCFRGQLPLFVSDVESNNRIAQYSGEGLTAEEAQAAVRLTNDCRACCGCDDYVRTYRGLKRMWDKWAEVSATGEAARDTYEENRARWMTKRACIIENPARMAVQGDKNCKVFAGGAYQNVTACCTTQVEIRFTVQKYEAGEPDEEFAGASVVEAYLSASSTTGEEKYAPLITGPVVQFFADYADPSSTTTARMKLCSACAADNSVSVTMTVHIADPPPDPHTGAVCEMPTATVPADILQIWEDAGISPGPTVRAVIKKDAPLNPDAPTFNCEC